MRIDDLYEIADKVNENLKEHTNGLVLEYTISGNDLEKIDRELYDIANNGKTFKHTKVVNVVINEVTFRLKEK